MIKITKMITIPNNQVEVEDHGEWMCLVNDNEQFDAVKQFVFLEVILIRMIMIMIMMVIMMM